MSERLENAQKQAYKIVYGWNIDYKEMIEQNKVETLKKRREKASLSFALKNKDKDRFNHWFPRATSERPARDSTRRPYLETRARTERAKSNPIQSMIRHLNKNHFENVSERAIEQ